MFGSQFCLSAIFLLFVFFHFVLHRLSGLKFEGKMLRQFHAVMQDTADFRKAIFGDTTQQEMTRFSNATWCEIHMIGAVSDVVRFRPFCQVWPFLSSGAAWIARELQHCLHQQFFVAQANLRAEFAVSPGEDCFNSLESADGAKNLIGC